MLSVSKGDILLEDTLLKAVSILANLIERRIKIYEYEFLYTSQESIITFLYTYSLVHTDLNLLDKVFVDYPFTKQSGSRGKFDIYIDINPGYYIEVKYIRPIPSGMNIPLPQHRGSLINDLVRLSYRAPTKAKKYLLLVACREFITHISNKPGFPTRNKTWRGRIKDLIVTETEDKKISKENRTYLDQKLELQLLRHEVTRLLHIILWKVITLSK